MHQLLGNCLEEAGVALDMSSSISAVFWHEAELSIGTVPDHRTTQEILWELYELNFRFELVALDQRARLTPVESEAQVLSHQLLLMACFPSKVLLVADISSANQGLASPTLQGRAQYLIAMKRLMKSWGGNVPVEIHCLPADQAQGYSLQELAKLEEAITRFYTQSFFNHFGRAAILPHTLDSTADSIPALGGD
jgi:hypothetical protein